MEIIQTLIDPKTWVIILIVVAFFGIVGTIHFGLKLNEAKSWGKVQSSMYVRAIIRIAELKKQVKTAINSTKRKGLRKEIARLRLENSDMEKRLNNEIDRNKKIMLSKFDLIKEINELKHINEDAVVEVTKLRSENKDTLSRIKRLTETIEHRKHVITKEPKTVISVESITDNYRDFPKGETFRLASVQPKYESLINVIARNGNKFQAQRCDFKTVKL